MAFWQSAGASSCQRRAAAEPARPVTLVLHAAADFSSLVRMRVKLPAYDAMPDDEEDEAAQQAAAAARGTRLQQAILGVEASSSEAHAAAITEVLDTATLQLLCQKVRAHARGAPCVSSLPLQHRDTCGLRPPPVVRGGARVQEPAATPGAPGLPARRRQVLHQPRAAGAVGAARGAADRAGQGAHRQQRRRSMR